MARTGPSVSPKQNRRSRTWPRRRWKVLRMSRNAYHDPRRNAMSTTTTTAPRALIAAASGMALRLIAVTAVAVSVCLASACVPATAAEPDNDITRASGPLPGGADVSGQLETADDV